MNKKRDILTDILQWLLIIISVVSVWMGGYIAGLKVHEIEYHSPNIVLNEKKANDNDLEYFTPSQSSIFSMFTTASTTTYPLQNVYAVRYTAYANLELDTTTFFGLTGYLDICLSNSQRYDSTFSNYGFNFNSSNIQSFDFGIDYELSLNDFDNISFFVYASAFDGNELEITLELYVNNDYFIEYNFYYQMPFSPFIFQSFDLNVLTELVNKDILDNYTLGYDRGYYDGKLDGYDEGYYDKEDEYNATDSAFQKVWNIISNAFASVFNVFNIELFAGIKLFHILAIPLIISVLYFVIKILAK